MAVNIIRIERIEKKLHVRGKYYTDNIFVYSALDKCRHINND